MKINEIINEDSVAADLAGFDRHPDAEKMVARLKAIDITPQTSYNNGNNLILDRKEREVVDGKYLTSGYKYKDRVMIDMITGAWEWERITKGIKKTTIIGSGIGLDDNFKKLTRVN